MAETKVGEIKINGTASVTWPEEKPEEDHPAHPDEVVDDVQEDEKEGIAHDDSA